RERIPLPVGDGNDGVVEGRVHVRDRIEHVLAGLLRLLGRRGGCRGGRRRAALLGFLLGFLLSFLLSHSSYLSGGCVQLDRLLARTLAGARVGARAMCASLQPWRCLCRGSEQMTYTTRRRRTILQFLQIFLTEGRTFMTDRPSPCDRSRAGSPS